MIVYFPKWYLKGVRSSPSSTGAVFRKFVNLDYTSYLRFLAWRPSALKMPELELIEHSGLDSAVYLRIYLLGLKIFVPITLLGFAILVPVNYTNDTLESLKVDYSEIDKLSISNVPKGSDRVLVRNVPPDPDESIDELVEHFFLVNHPPDYLAHQLVYDANKLTKIVKKKKKMQNWLDFYQLRFERNPSKKLLCPHTRLGLWGRSVDAIEYYQSETAKLSKEEVDERDRIMKNPKSIMPAAFVSFRTRWGAAVCAQTQQTRNPTIWLTMWAPEPRDVYWNNLAIPFVQLTVRRLIVAVAFFFLAFFFMIPIALYNLLQTLKGLRSLFPF
ncbi:hypothetical protein KSP39_PZI015822 [Platanthera zijinensis]|uniref:CSC1/OSCA1-like cytosolic domain-containing protein n=1 Tax=Platanthera zijinensis TaxID=2320716 RepID=A0AAP0B8P0_9ASPA